MLLKISCKYVPYALLFCILLFIPNSSFSKNLKITSWANFQSGKPFLNSKYQNSFLNDTSGIQIINDNHNLATNFTLNINNDQLLFDNSYLEYKNTNVILGIGKINRNWSFSPNTSLILSQNARPSDSIYFTLKNENRIKDGLLSLIGPWSFEAFNSILSNSKGPDNSMLLGMRVIIEPLANLEFEIVKTSQWGGKGQSQGLSALSSAIFGDTNEKKNSYINQLAGVGFNFSTNVNKLPVNIYGQLIGEDEAGYLPSCKMHMIGSQLKFLNNKFFSNVGLELADTRIQYGTANDNCGPNSAYNNAIYSYTNYGTSMGAPFDTEGKSIYLWGSTKLSEKSKINYSIKHILVNDTGWVSHRLSSSRQEGNVATLGASWQIKSLNIKTDLSYQNFSLEKINSHSGISIGFNSTIDF